MDKTLRSFDTPVKRRVRAEYREFLRETVLRHKKPGEVKVLCLPGYEAIESFEVYDRLGIPRRNVYAAEWDKEAFERLKARNLGINVWHGDVFDYLGYAGLERIKAAHSEFTILLRRKEIEQIVNAEPLRIIDYEYGGKHVEVKAKIPALSDVNAWNVPEDWLRESFDIVALDICGHITAKVVNGLSSCFRAGLLRDRGVFTITSLASREHPLTKLLIQMAFLMDAIVRGTMWEAAHDIRPGMVTYPYEDLQATREATRERIGLDALIILLAFGNDLFMELIKLYNMSVDHILLSQMPRNTVFDRIMEVESDPTAMICKRNKRFSYQSEASPMRVTFAQFRKAAQAVRETGNIMEAIHHLGHSLSSPLTKIETPVQHLSKSEVLAKIRSGDFVG